jgi:hypothetical protein
MKSGFIFAGNASAEIDSNIENDSNIGEGYQRHYLYPQNLFQLLLEKKNVNAEFIKPDKMGIYEH